MSIHAGRRAANRADRLNRRIASGRVDAVRLWAVRLFMLLSTCAGMSFTVIAHAENDRVLIDESKIPLAGWEAGDFVPAGWVIESSIDSDLDGDGKPDRVLMLIEALPGQTVGDMPPSRARALVLLLQTPSSGYRRAALAKRLLRCTDCFGMMAGPDGGGAEIRVVKRVLIVEELWGARETVQTRLRFRHDARSGRFALIGEDIDYTDRGKGTAKRISRNFLTGIELTETRRFDEKKGSYVGLPGKKRSIPRNRRYIEEIDYQDYEHPMEPAGSQ